MNVRRKFVRGARFDARFVTVLALVAGSVAACEASNIPCEETATCPPPPSPEAAAPDVSDEPGDADAEVPDAGVDADARDTSADPRIETTIDAGADLTVDAPRWDGAEGGPKDATLDRADREADAEWCDPTAGRSPADNPCLIDNRYAVFVSPAGNDFSGAGTRSAPLKTIGRALQFAKGNVTRVFACDDGTGFVDAVTIDATLDGMALYGGFECTGWTYSTTRRAKVRPPSGVPLSVKGLTAGLIVEDFEFDAADAAVGESSIGTIVETSLNVVLRGVKIVTGKGGAGAEGAQGAKGGDGTEVMSGQVGFAAACPFGPGAQSGGSWTNASTCGSLGGAGGQAVKNANGGSGGFGVPQTGVTPPNIDNSGTNGLVGSDGDAGSVGEAGTNGMPNAVPGTFTAAGYTTSLPGGDGTVGHVGQGGGGGGASNAMFGSGCIGASGGAGGIGGCGGKPGVGGAGGGAAVAVMSWQSNLTLDRCELVATDAGAGGNGGNGGPGGAGKAGGSGGEAYDAPDGGGGVNVGKAGNGGNGGNGGPGGSGAGGNGGPSYALVYKGDTPVKLNGTMLAHGAGGAKGTGGSVEMVKAPDGFPGASADEFSVP